MSARSQKAKARAAPQTPTPKGKRQKKVDPLPSANPSSSSDKAQMKALVQAGMSTIDEVHKYFPHLAQDAILPLLLSSLAEARSSEDQGCCFIPNYDCHNTKINVLS